MYFASAAQLIVCTQDDALRAAGLTVRLQVIMTGQTQDLSLFVFSSSK